jgi:hypothetical protein
MAKKKKEEPKVNNEVGKLKVKEQKEKQPTNNETKGNVTKVKEKMIMKPEVLEQTVTKVDLNKSQKTEENANQKQEATEVATDKPTETLQEVVEEVPSKQESVQNEDTPIVEEVTGEESIKEEVEELKEKVTETIIDSEKTGKELPENIQKLMNFMDETGGDINDYVLLNQDYSEMDSHTLLQEYYKQNKPHLSSEEIDFLMEDQFSYDEEVDDEREVKRKKLALKEQVASAKTQLEENKSKYYEELKAGSKLTPDQQKAIDFFNRYNKETEESQKIADEAKSHFMKKTNEVFNDGFKGFEYNVGDKRFRFNVNNADQVKDDQSDFRNFVGKFLNEEKYMEDAEGYHKGLFTANNADAIAKHFYEQGKADAIKTSVEKGKNIDMEPRQAHGAVTVGGITVRALGDNSSDFKFKIKQK